MGLSDTGGQKAPGRKTGFRSSSKPARKKNSRGGPKGEARGSGGAAVTPTLRVRRGAARIVTAVTTDGRTLDDALAEALTGDLASLDARDIAFARLIAVTTLRRIGQINAVLAHYMAKPIDHRAPFARATLQTAVAQLLFLDVPAHAVIDVAVQTIKGHRKSQHFCGLVNAVLRKVAAGGAELVAAQDATALNTPEWMMTRWSTAYGPDTAAAIASAHLVEPALDLTFRSANDDLVAELDGCLLSTGSVRLRGAGRVDVLAGFAEGAWWVQDAAAALPAHLLGDVRDKRVLDLCAAPGGKTAQLCSAGAHVTALDNSASRMPRMTENLARLDMSGELVVGDIMTWQPSSPYDAVLLDAPCSATGTMRRHPDLALLKSPADIAALAAQQADMLAAAADFVAPGGTLVYCTCSLEPEEGPERIAAFLAAHEDFVIRAATADELNCPTNWITPEGFLRTLPHYEVPRLSGDGAMAGVDGFFAARMERKALGADAA